MPVATPVGFFRIPEVVSHDIHDESAVAPREKGRCHWVKCKPASAEGTVQAPSSPVGLPDSHPFHQTLVAVRKGLNIQYCVNIQH